MSDGPVVAGEMETLSKTEVLVGEIDNTMSELMLAARQAEDLKPLTEAEAEKMTVPQLGDRAALIFSHFKFTLMSERAFILRFHVELSVLRERTAQQGRRVPISGCPTWGEIKKQYFKLSGRRIDDLLKDAKPEKNELGPGFAKDRHVELSDDLPESQTPSDETVEKIHEAADEPDEALPESDVLPDEPAEQGQHESSVADVMTPETIANFLNGVYAQKAGRHDAVRQMVKLLEKCILWEISYAGSEERSNRLRTTDLSVRHVFPYEAAKEVLDRGGFWSAEALIEEADIHVTSDASPNTSGVSLVQFKEYVLGELRRTGQVKTRSLGRVYWYTRTGNEAALKAAKKVDGPEFHYAKGELGAKAA